MQSKFILCLTSVASILGKACGKGIYHTPKAESFATVNIQVGYPVNTTTPDGIVGMFPVLSGNITGKFTGRLVPSLSSTTERILNSSPSSGVFSVSRVGEPTDRPLTYWYNRMSKPNGYLKRQTRAIFLQK